MDMNASRLLQLYRMESGEHDAEATPAKIEKLRAAIEPAVLAQYDAARVRHGLQALVPVRSQGCGACHMSLSSLKKATVQLSIIECEYCGRLIYDSELIYADPLSRKPYDRR